jgi:hypothetical protein
MKLTKTVIFKILVVYKSGYTHDFECTNFKITGGRYDWNRYDDNNKPIFLGVDDVAAVWQVGYRTKYSLFGGK